MKITSSKDTLKVNAILPIMQEHLGNHMNLVHIKLMALLLHALCVAQTVRLHKLASAKLTDLDCSPNQHRLAAMVCIAMVFAHLVEDHKDVDVKAIRILKHGRRAKSIVKYGLEETTNVLLRPTYTPKCDVFNFLSCT